MSRAPTPARRPLSGLGLLAVGLGAAALFFVALAFDLGTLRLLAKPVPALVLGGWVVRRGAPRIGPPVAVGLGLSAVGDYLLERGWFVPGLLAFLSAHLAYTVAFVLAAPRLALRRALPFLAFGLTVFLVLRPGLGPLAIPVGVYVAVICTMMWRAAARVGAGPGWQGAPWLGLAGALAFAASDTLIAFDRFHGGIAGARMPVMILYWLGQWGIAASAGGTLWAAHGKLSTT